MLNPTDRTDTLSCTYADIAEAAKVLGLDPDKLNETLEIRITPGYIVAVRAVHNEHGGVYHEALHPGPLATTATVIRVIGA